MKLTDDRSLFKRLIELVQPDLRKYYRMPRKGRIVASYASAGGLWYADVQPLRNDESVDPGEPVLPKLELPILWGGQNRGFVCPPAVDTYCIIGYLDGDPSYPFIMDIRWFNQSAPEAELTELVIQQEPGVYMKIDKKHKIIAVTPTNIEDEAGEDWIVQVGRDTTVDIGRNLVTSVGVDATLAVGNNCTGQVGVDTSLETGNNLQVSVGADAELEAGNNLQVTVGESASLHAGKDVSREAGATLNDRAGVNITSEAAVAQNHSAGANYNITAPAIDLNGMVTMRSVDGGATSAFLQGDFRQVGRHELEGPLIVNGPVNFTGTVSINGNLVTAGNSYAASRSGGVCPHQGGGD